MKLIKAIISAISWFLCPTCDHEAGVCVAGQGKKCKHKEDENGIERHDYHFENGIEK